MWNWHEKAGFHASMLSCHYFGHEYSGFRARMPIFEYMGTKRYPLVPGLSDTQRDGLSGQLRFTCQLRLELLNVADTAGFRVPATIMGTKRSR